METVSDGLNRPSQDFAQVGAWPESIGRGGAAGLFNSAVLNPAHHANKGMSAKEMASKQMDTSRFCYTSLS